VIGNERVDSVTYSPYVLQLRATSVKVGDIRLVDYFFRKQTFGDFVPLGAHTCPNISLQAYSWAVHLVSLPSLSSVLGF
jgi:hypothetical protein